MTSMAVASQRGHHLDRLSAAGLVDVVDLILGKGLVIDLYVRVSLVGIELLTADARVVVAGVDTYLRFAEAVNRLDPARSGTGTSGLPGPMQEMRGGGAKHKTKGALEGTRQKADDILRGGRDDEEPPREAERPRDGSRPAARRERQERER